MSRAANNFHRSWTSATGAVEHITDVEPGEYQLRISDATGYTIDDELWVQAVDAPTIPLQENYTLHAEAPLQLDAHVEGAFVTYEWEREGVVIGTSASVLIDRTGRYQCTVVADGCAARKYFDVTSTSEDGPFEMAVLPNPAADGQFVVQVAMPTAADARLLISNSGGEPVIQRELKGNSFYRVQEHLDIPGLYLVTVEVNGKQRTQKVVVM
ncbi:MAG: T9SS type A sorting domain-containing protein [Flavobacteriales bacterium]|nr:T9SS type A sorting domain-containing protein [Flavobacteriales bacterium]